MISTSQPTAQRGGRGRGGTGNGRGRGTSGGPGWGGQMEAGRQLVISTSQAGGAEGSARLNPETPGRGPQSARPSSWGRWQQGGNDNPAQQAGRPPTTPRAYVLWGKVPLRCPRVTPTATQPTAVPLLPPPPTHPTRVQLMLPAAPAAGPQCSSSAAPAAPLTPGTTPPHLPTPPMCLVLLVSSSSPACSSCCLSTVAIPKRRAPSMQRRTMSR